MIRALAASALVVLSGCSTATMNGVGGGSGGGTSSAGGGMASSAGGGAGGGSGGTGGGATGGEVCDNQMDDDNDGKTDCSDPECFSFAQCCFDLCSDGTSICDTGGVRTCALNPATKCRSFAPAVTCNGGLLCSGGGCVATCSNQCTAGAKQCSSSGSVVECKLLGSGCTDWVLQPACAQGQACSGGACVVAGQCTNQCTQAATRCTAGGQIQQCVQLMSGCTDWSFPAMCGGNQTCTAPATACTAPPACTMGSKRCNATSPFVETCDGAANWVNTQSCPQACSMGACTTSAACTPGAVRCNTNNVEICNSSGSAWLYSQSCNVGCNLGVCTDPCTTGAKRCNAQVPETCNAAGTGWTAAASCTQGCYLGDCMSADLLITGVTQTMEGDLAYANSVVINNGGSLRVGPTGILKIRAKTITIDGASNINGNDVGEDTRGSVTGVSNTCCTYMSGATCYCTATGPGPGASYGTMGATGGTVSAYCPSYGATRSCTLGAALAPYDRSDDLSISEGSKWMTSKGGGLIQLIATNIDIKGQITANATGSGASGGGILIAADTITGNGALQASGAATSPTGGNGRVKLLRGSTNTFSGSVTGVKADSPMPPLDLVSGSHPDPARWYNDGLGDWFLAWSKPFPTLNGYYYKVSTSAATLPSQANGMGTFHQAETHVVKAADLVQGVNYIHLVTVDSGFNVGNVKSTFSTNINTQPPAIASSSHPTQRTWYQNNALYFTWANPQTDANFNGYYYLLDKYADTLPPTVQANFTSSKQVLLANTTNGIWVFHLLNRDTRGAVTKAASHHVVYVGPALDVDNLSGSVFDGSNGNAPLSGVTISINRGLFTQPTTGAGTYTFSGNLFVGQWEATASKVGYLPQTKMITLAKGSPLTENFTLLKAP